MEGVIKTKKDKIKLFLNYWPMICFWKRPKVASISHKLRQEL